LKAEIANSVTLVGVESGLANRAGKVRRRWLRRESGYSKQQGNTEANHFASV
jgi:hypothetical protein